MEKQKVYGIICFFRTDTTIALVELKDKANKCGYELRILDNQDTILYSFLYDTLPDIEEIRKDLALAYELEYLSLPEFVISTAKASKLFDAD